MKSSGLTPKQKRVADFIRDFRGAHGYAPSQREIADRFGFRSLGTVQNYLSRLEAHGMVTRAWNAKRALEVSGPVTGDSGVPLLGRVAAGQPIDAVECPETLDVPPWMMGLGEHFALRIQGESMVGDGILDGDYVVVRRQSDAADGQTVVAVVDGEATVKRLRRVSEGVELVAANPAMAPIVVREGQGLRIAGIVVGVLRRCL